MSPRLANEPSSNHAASRPPSILDAMVLVAAFACAIVASERLSRASLVPREGLLTTLVLGSQVIVLTLSVATLAFRLCSPRPSRRSLWCQPGFVACFAAVVATGLTFTHQLISNEPLLRRAVRPSRGHLFANLAIEFPVAVYYAVAIAWASLYLSGRWRSERSWVDLVGRICGWFWLTIPLVTIALGWRPLF